MLHIPPGREFFPTSAYLPQLDRDTAGVRRRCSLGWCGGVRHLLDAGKGGIRPAVLGYHLKADAVVLAVSSRSDGGDYVVADAVWWEPRLTTERDSLSR